ncbi:MAG: MerR family transcriptional regulator [Lachnospiraceae bacterium]|nr:MerR family transcriptional regulator [Lachnospiraceae bacterium]
MRTVKDVSRLAGISIRTLHYYDEIGLLKPTEVTAAGYRLYSDRDLERLQEIMFFKEMELPLKKIRLLMEHPEIDRQEILMVQQAALERKRNRLNGIIELIRDVRKGVNTMSFEAFTEEDIDKITEHTIKQMKPEDIRRFVEKFGDRETFREELAKNLKDPETEAHLIKLYGGREKAVAASLSAQGSREEMTAFMKETDEIYRQFAKAMKTGDGSMKEDALKRLAESNKALWQIGNIRYYLLQLADTLERYPEMMAATDKAYGEGVTLYIANAIREHYGV